MSSLDQKILYAAFGLSVGGALADVYSILVHLL